MPKFLSDGIFEGSSTDLIVDGKIGIGTASPSQKLDVNGNIELAQFGYIYFGSNTSDQLTIHNSLSGSQIIQRGSSYLELQSFNGSGIKFNVGGFSGTDVMVVTSSANVGIGTTSPSEKLHVVGNGIFEAPDTSLSYPIKIYTNKVDAYDRTSGILFNTGYTDPSRGKGALVYDYISSNGWNRGDFHFLQNTAANSSVASLADSVLTIKNSGNVGIGTTSPSYKLDVSGSFRATSESTFTSNLLFPDDARIKLGTGQDFHLYHTGINANIVNYTGDVYIQNQADNKDIIFAAAAGTANPTEILRIDGSSGNVGIGTTSPDADLHIAKNSGNAILQLQRTGTNSGSSKLTVGNQGRLIVSSDRFITFNTDGSERMRVDYGGNVGIGTTSPSQKLDVVGTNNDPIIRAVRGNDTSQYLDIRGYQVLSQGNNLLLTADDTKEIWLGQESNTQRMVINSSGNVGIGTTSPGEKLTLQTQATGLGSEGVFIKNPFAGSTPIVNSKSPFLSLATSNSSGYTSTIYMGRNGTATGQESKIEWSNSNNGLSIYVAGQGSYREHVRFGNLSSSFARTYFNGTVGIGTTSPAYLLDVNEDDNVLAFRVTGGGGGAPIASFVRDVGATGSSVNINAQSNFPQIQFTNTSNTFSIGGDTSGNFKISDNTAIGTNDRITIDNTGNVGIGTASPGQKLSVAPSTDVSGEFGQAHVGNVGYNGYAGFSHVDRNSAGNYALLQQGDGTTFLNASTGKPINFRINNSDKMILDSSGKVGIGTTSPNQKLTIKGTDQYVAAEQTNYVWGTTTTIGVRMGTDATAGLLDFRRWVGTATTHGTALITQVSSDGGYGLDFRLDTKTSNTKATTSRMFLSQSGEVGIGTTDPYYMVHLGGDTVGAVNGQLAFGHVANVPSGLIQGYRVDGSYKGELRFLTSTSGGSVTQRMVIDDDGNVGISDTSPSHRLSVSGNVKFRYDTSAGGEGVLFQNNTSGGAIQLGFQQQDSDGLHHRAYIVADKDSAGSIGGKLSFRTRAVGGGTTETMTLRSDGNVGIGTTSPSEKLAVSGGNIEIADSTAGRKIGFDVSDSISFNSTTIAQYGMSNAGNSEAGGITYSGFFGQKFFTNGTQRMVIQRYGNVGIGTTSPVAKLDIDDSSNDVSLTNTANYAINTGSAISVRHYRNVNLETPKMQWSIGGATDLNWKKLATIVINDANYAGFGAEVEITDFSGNYGSSMAQYGDVYKGGLSIFHRAGTGVEPEQGIITIHSDMSPYIRIYKIAGSGNSSYQIQVKSPGNYRQIHVKLEQGNGNQVASITPHANDTNGSTSGGTAYTPDAYTSGNQFKSGLATMSANRGIVLYRLGIGTTSPAYQLELSQNSAAKPTSSAWTVVSDKRVKTNIRPYETGLDKLLQIEPKVFDYNGKAGFDTKAKNNIGVIAQEIKDIMPETVKKYNAKLNEEDEEDTELYNFDSHALTFALINSVKELNAKIENLESRIQTLENQ